MKYYFDHRNYTDSFVKVVINDKLMGYTFLKKNKITCIIIPEDTKKVELWYSFEKFNNCKKIEKKVYDDNFFTFNQRNISQKYQKEIDDKWKFPYYCVIDAEIYKEDIYFYPTYLYPDEVSNKDLKGIMTYKGVLLSTNEKIEIGLKKDGNMRSKLIAFRKKLLFKNIIMITTCLFLIPSTLYQLSSEDIRPMTAKGVAGFFILAVILLIINLIDLRGNFKYCNMIDYSKLPNEITI